MIFIQTIVLPVICVKKEFYFFPFNLISFPSHRTTNIMLNLEVRAEEILVLFLIVRGILPLILYSYYFSDKKVSKAAESL